ncbi:high affinity cationic amino acid transporter 1-like isoform X2 [Rhodnius prolixus]
MEYVIGAASVARGLSLYLDSMFGNQMEAFYRTLYEFRDMDFISEYFDILAFGISSLVTIGLAVGVKESLLINNLLTFINVSIVLFVIVVGAFKVDLRNWSLPKIEVPPWAGEGGFLPYGVMGAIKGAATCFYGYVGFDVIATSGEEVKDPQKSIPLAIISALTIIFLAYFGLSAVLTLMWPYYLQDVDAPIPHVFLMVGWDWAAWIVAVGGIFGLLASLFSGLFPLPRIIYSMANDGLMFRWLGSVSPRFGTPFIGTLVAGLITSFMAATFKLKQLVDLMSIGTLLAYAIVAACVLLLRYKETNEQTKVTFHLYGEHTNIISQNVKVTWCSIMGQMFNHKGISEPTELTSTIATTFTILFSFFSIALAYILVIHETSLLEGNICPLILSIILATLMVLCVICISRQPSDTSTLSFKVPLVPGIPCFSIFLNIYLMMMMDVSTWLRFLVWMIVGYVIYFGYGIFHSVERRDPRRVDYEILKGDEEVDVT